MNDNTRYKIGYVVGRAQGPALVAFAVYGAYSLIKLGYDWSKAIREELKERKELKTNH
jgi:hypothetical protein